MIAPLIALVLAAALLSVAYVARLHPDVSMRRIVQAASSALAVIVLVAGIALYPRVSVWQSYQAGEVAMTKYTVEKIRAKHMIRLLGSPEAYIEYLKAIKQD